MAWHPDNLVIKGALGVFYERLEHGPEVWRNHCQIINSTAATERHSFPGALPIPRRMLDGRQWQGLLDFTFQLENYTYEMSFVVNRTHFEDDQTGLINGLFGQAADAWKSWKDELFAQLLENGNVAGNTAYDGVVYHGDSRTIGSSGTIDNNTTSAAATGTTPTASELLDALNTEILARMWEYEDDQGRPGMVKNAMSQVRLVVPSNMIRAAAEGGSATILSQTSNVYGQGLFTFDVLPNLSANDEMFVNAVGSTTKPFIFQQKEPLEVVVDTSAEGLATHDGVRVMTRERFRFGYGEPRMSVLHTWS